MKRKIIIFLMLSIIFCLILGVGLISCGKDNFDFEKEIKKIEVKLNNANKQLKEITADDILLFNYDKKLDITITNVEENENFIMVYFKVKYKDKEASMSAKLDVNNKSSQPNIDIQNDEEGIFDFEKEIKKIEVKLNNANKQLKEITADDILLFNYDKKLDITITNVEKNENFIKVHIIAKYNDKKESKSFNIKLPKIEDFIFNYTKELTSLEIKEENIEVKNSDNLKVFNKQIVKRNYDNIQLQITVNNGIILHKSLETNTDFFKKGKENTNICIDKFGLILDLLNEKEYFTNNLKPSKMVEKIITDSVLSNGIISLKINDVAYNDIDNTIKLKFDDFKILNTLINANSNIVQLKIKNNVHNKIKSEEIKSEINTEYQTTLIKEKIKLTDFLKNKENLARLIKLNLTNGLDLYAYKVEFYNVKEVNNNKFSYSIKIKEIQYSKDFGGDKKIVGENDLFTEVKSFESRYYLGGDVLDYIAENELTKEENITNFPSCYKEVIDKKIQLANSLINLTATGKDIFDNYFGEGYIINFELSCDDFNDLEGSMGISVQLKASKENDENVTFSKVSKKFNFVNLVKFGDIKNESITLAKQNDETFKKKLTQVIDKNKDTLKNHNDVIIDENSGDFMKFITMKNFNFDLSNESGDQTLKKYNENFSKCIKLNLGENGSEFSTIYSSDKGIYLLKLGDNDKYIALDGIIIDAKSIKIHLEDDNMEGDSRFMITVAFAIRYTFKNSSNHIERDVISLFPINYKI